MKDNPKEEYVERKHERSQIARLNWRGDHNERHEKEVFAGYRSFCSLRVGVPLAES